MTWMKLAKLCFAIITLATCLPVQSADAGNFAYMSATGGGTTCSAAAPCSSFFNALVSVVASGGRILCLDPVADSQSIPNFSPTSLAVDIDCPAGSWAGNSSIIPILTITGSDLTLTLRNMTFNGIGGATGGISYKSSGPLILEDCVITDAAGIALDIEPTGLLNLVIRNSRISNNTAGIRLAPAAGGSISATFDHVVINGNGGGINAVSTNGAVNLDVADSEISDSTSVGVQALAGTNQSMVSIKNSVIARNGQQGVIANGVNAAVLVATTLLDQNAAGATSLVSGGRILTYVNNQIVGPIGSGFTGTAPLQ